MKKKNKGKGSRGGSKKAYKKTQEIAKGSRREFFSQILASSAALAGLGLLTKTLGASKADAAGQRKPIITELRGTPVKLRTLEKGLSLELSSRELAQHLANEGVIDPKHRQGIATVRYDLVIG